MLHELLDVLVTAGIRIAMSLDAQDMMTHEALVLRLAKHGHYKLVHVAADQPLVGVADQRKGGGKYVLREPWNLYLELFLNRFMKAVLADQVLLFLRFKGKQKMFDRGAGVLWNPENACVAGGKFQKIAMRVRSVTIAAPISVFLHPSGDSQQTGGEIDRQIYLIGILAFVMADF